MTASAIIALLEDLVSAVPLLTPELLKLYADVAHGEGGVGKVQSAVSDLGALAVTAATLSPQVPPASGAPTA
jgi:hypothetical protein